MSLASRRISYAVGAAAWGSKAAQEGLAVLSHFEPEPVTDSTSLPQTAGAYRAPAGPDGRIGAMYYMADIPVRFTPAHAVLLLDKFFESAAVGSAPNYDRTYQLEHVPGEPVTPYLNLWKKTAKVGLDHNLCLYNGLVAGVTLRMAPNALLTLSARCAFGGRSQTEADPAKWTIDWTHGNVTPVRLHDTTFYVAPPGGTPVAYKVTEFEISVSCDFTPHVWGAQGVSRWSRGKAAVTGYFQLRDITSQVETLAGYLEGSTVRTLICAMGSYAVASINAQFVSGGGFEDDATRRGKFNFTGVAEPSATVASAFQLWLRAGRAYTP